MRHLDGQIARPDGSLLRGRITFDAAVFDVQHDGGAPADDYILPGLIDLQVNGRGALDAMAADPEVLVALAQDLTRAGTTAFLATAVTAPWERLAAVDEAVRQARRYLERGTGLEIGAVLLGLHLEGPFISGARLGAHQAFFELPSAVNLRRLFSFHELRLLTLAPEIPGALEAIRLLRERGIVVSLGHTEASLEQARAALAAGAGMFTHVFNAMGPLHHRELGAAGAALLAEGAAYAAVIPDGIHVHPEMLRLIYRARGVAGLIITSDSVATAAPAAGALPRALDAQAHQGAARTAEGRLAGSLITMLEGLRLMVTQVGVPVAEAARMAATNPAALLGLAGLGRLEQGARANLIVLDRDLNLKTVFVGGAELR